MILTDYLKSERDLSWDYAKQCGVRHAVVRLPEDPAFNVTDAGHWRQVYDRFTAFGLKPIVIEPMPNALHDHIKAGDASRDACIEKVISMFAIMDSLDIRTICFNFMAYLGWTRTASNIEERGGALVTGFKMRDFHTDCKAVLSAEKLWENYRYFIDAVLPYAERYHIRLALHPDDPPVERLAGVSRIFTSSETVWKGVTAWNSDCLGVTLCQATFRMMGEDLTKVIPAFAKQNKILFIHFRDAVGNKLDFHETFHDNGPTDMAAILRLYQSCGVNVPIRVDHVPCMAGENITTPGYGKLGRLFALGYLKGLCDAIR